MRVPAPQVIVAILAAITLPSTLLIAAGQAPAPPTARPPTAVWPPAGPTPRTPDGKPDLSGNWEPNAIRQNVDLIGSGVDVPLLPAAAARRRRIRSNPHSAESHSAANSPKDPVSHRVCAVLDL